MTKFMRYFSFITEILQKIILRLMKTHYLMVQIVIGSVKLRSWLYFKKESLQVTLLKYWKRVDSCDSDSRNQCNPSEIALTVCPRQRWLMFNISWQPVVFDSGNWLRWFSADLQHKYQTLSLGSEHCPPLLSTDLGSQCKAHQPKPNFSP